MDIEYLNKQTEKGFSACGVPKKFLSNIPTNVATARLIPESINYDELPVLRKTITVNKKYLKRRHDFICNK